ncbi:MAG: thiamine pyrophosphate-binding protein [Solirubrobacterales bacterium]|nr:thiamine pyrophosphate-binding protein [Solirubrobacterales bacterium]
MSEITGGELFARALEAEGIEFMFGLPSPASDPILAQLKSHGIRFVPVRHEAAAVHMAEGLYRTTGKVGAVIGNPGPGSANLLPGVITALHEGTPVMVITSQHRMGVVYPSTPATYQGQDQVDLFRPTVKWGGPIFDWARIPEVMQLAFREMWNGRPGPVHVDLPSPVIYETRDESTAPVQAPTSYRSNGPEASAGQLDEATAILLSAKRPVVISGTGVDRAGANEALLEVVGLLGCPVITTGAGRSTVSAEHPNFVYGFGGAGDEVRREADVLLVAGSRIGNLDVPYDKYWGDPSGQRLIQIDIDQANFGVTRPLELGIVSDARNALDGIAERLRSSDIPERSGDDLARYRALDEKLRGEQATPILEWHGPGIHPAHAMGVIGSVFGSEAVYNADGGNTALWAHAILPPTRPRSYHSTPELGMLGVGIPMGIGSKLGAPERNVVCISGDGAAGFNFMEMQSAARENLDITAVVFAEGSWTMEVPNEIEHYGETFGTDQGEIRWDVAAEGLGCHGEYVETIEDLEPALRRAKDHDGPSVICLRTDIEANLAVPEAMVARFSEVYTGPAGGE